ncbi:MAG: GNAT family N-acetyltransferase [Burkholderiales bacterium]|nr:GNAT family N-acetyltransferase [Burkholderiales bacterium]
MDDDAFTIALVRWNEASAALAGIRRRVFIEEQSVPEALEWDRFDAVSTHALARSADGDPIGTARLLPDGHVGRLAVLAPWRHRGVGKALLLAMLAEARRAGHADVVLAAQVTVMTFYRRFGFVAEGDVFDDAGIPHRQMRLRLGPLTP